MRSGRYDEDGLVGEFEDLAGLRPDVGFAAEGLGRPSEDHQVGGPGPGGAQDGRGDVAREEFGLDVQPGSARKECHAMKDHGVGGVAAPIGPAPAGRCGEGSVEQAVGADVHGAQPGVQLSGEDDRQPGGGEGVR